MTEKHNEEVFNKFIRHIQSQGVGTHRQKRYQTAWNRLSQEIDYKLDQASIDDLKRTVGQINSGELKKQNGGQYSESSKAEFRKFLNKLYTDYLDYDKTSLDWLKSSADSSKQSKIDPEEIPKPDHVKQMIDAARHPRDEVIMMTLWDTGARIGGLVKTQYNQDSNSEPLRWNRVKFKENHVQLTIRDKSGERKIPVRESMPYLREHWERHKDEIDSMDEVVFKQLQPKRNGDRAMTAGAVRRMIKKTRKETEIPDYVKLNPHAWRKGRATYLASIGRNQAQLCAYFGWVQGSKEAAKYIRLAKKDLEKALMEEHGLEASDDDNDTDLRPVKCGSCGSVNAATWDLCRECNADVSGETPEELVEDENKKRMELEAKFKQMQNLMENLGIEPE